MNSLDAITADQAVRLEVVKAAFAVPGQTRPVTMWFSEVRIGR